MKNTIKKKYEKGTNRIYVYYSNQGEIMRYMTHVNKNEETTNENKKFIDNLINKFNKIWYDYTFENGNPPTISYMRQMINNKIHKNFKEDEIDMVYDKFYEFKSNNLKGDLTIKKYNESFRKIIVNFFKTEKISLKNRIDEKFLEKFIDYLKKSNYMDNYIIDLIKIMKHFILTSIDLKLIDRNKYQLNETLWKKYSGKSNGLVKHHTTTVSLTFDELSFIISKRKTENKVRKKALDMFIFQCLTSLRFSDLSRLDEKYIFDDTIKMKSKKTGEKLVIKLSPLLKEILEENNYSFNHKISGYNEILKRIFSTYANDCPSLNKEITIQEYRNGGELIVKKLEKYKLISSSCGRKTFITLNFKDGEDPTYIKLYTGHTKNSKHFFSYITDDLENNAVNLSKRIEDKLNSNKK